MFCCFCNENGLFYYLLNHFLFHSKLSSKLVHIDFFFIEVTFTEHKLATLKERIQWFLVHSQCVQYPALSSVQNILLKPFAY